MPEPRKPSIFAPSPVALILLVVGVIVANALYSNHGVARPVPYSTFLAALRAGRVARVEIRADQIEADLRPGSPGAAPAGGPPKAGEAAPNAAEATPKAAEGAPADATPEDIARLPEHIVTDRLPRMDETQLVEELRRRDVEITGKSEEPGLFGSFFYGVLPMLLVLAVWYFGLRRLQGRGGPMSFGKNKARLYDANKDKKVTFADVAGIDEAVAEMTEVVDFLRHPKKYTALGAKIPKGVLLVGPPGNGKTLMARAVAGEAGVPFFALSGSDFVEMFVGVGAARVRDLFEQAKERSPCIIFIDEIDAIGKSRGGLGAMAVHDEREQTLNQLLSEMDGFDATQGVVIIAATNRPEVLDAALVRAGRFDRQVVIDRPSWEGRLAILRVHCRNLTLAPGVNLEVVARRTPGMVGADLAKVANEAALAAARRESRAIEQRDFEEAIDRIQLGLKRRGRAMNDLEKRRVAYHESGHAIVALSLEHADPVHRVTIIPRTIGALGATLQLPTEDRYLALRSELKDQICVMLGGRAAEELTSGDLSTGAQNDLERATETARQMVCRFGMSDKLGPQTFGRPMGARFLDSPVAFGEERNFSEETARAIDGEVRSIIDAEHRRALAILERRRPLLDATAETLLHEETLERADLDALARRVELEPSGGDQPLPRVGT